MQALEMEGWEEMPAEKEEKPATVAVRALWPMTVGMEPQEEMVAELG
jgi:hypothetical protein